MRRTVIIIFVICAVFSKPALAQPEFPGAAAAAELPVSYGIVVDNSGSYRLVLERVIQLVSQIIEKNAPHDEAFLVTFVDTPKIVLRQDFTNRKSDLNDAAENMFIEGGQTAIIDAVKFAAQHLAGNGRAGPKRSRVLVLVTDGDERLSGAKMEDVLKILAEGNIRVFAVGMAEGKVYAKLLDRLTKETGGRKYLPKTKAEIAAVVSELAAAIRTK